MKKESGLLLHLTSLPGRYGIGDLGREARNFLDFLSASGQSLWQFLPLGPVDEFGSPYRSFSAFAGNPLLISPDGLVADGLLSKEELADVPGSGGRVDFAEVQDYKHGLFERAFARFHSGDFSGYSDFRAENNHWLEDYALFMALHEHFQGAPWNEWEQDVAERRPEALEHYSDLLSEQIEYHRFLQFVFFRQWGQFARAAADRGIQLVGDLPFFVAHDSSDVWQHPHYYKLDEEGRPEYVAGVPPDYFSKTGQLWGNPIYRWSVLAEDDYGWWRDRIAHLMGLVDLIRVDHFRGFAACWEVPAEAETALKGSWETGPGRDFFTVLENELGELPLFLENLGHITPDVEQLKEELGYPGMEVLQFTFQAGRWSVRNVLQERDLVLFTGTHDNDTLVGWYEECQQEQPEVVRMVHKFCDMEDTASGREVGRAVLSLAAESEAERVIFPLQDVLGLGREARMNTPGSEEGNWGWRFDLEDLKDETAEVLLQLTRSAGRAPAD